MTNILHIIVNIRTHHNEYNKVCVVACAIELTALGSFGALLLASLIFLPDKSGSTIAMMVGMHQDQSQGSFHLLSSPLCAFHPRAAHASTESSPAQSVSMLHCVFAFPQNASRRWRQAARNDHFYAQLRLA
jgi:hypothetical protein